MLRACRLSPYTVPGSRGATGGGLHLPTLEFLVLRMAGVAVAVCFGRWFSESLLHPKMACQFDIYF